jgi:hypothetical protein
VGYRVYAWKKDNRKLLHHVDFYFSQKKTSLEIAVFWVVAPGSLVEVYQRFRGPCCLHHQGDRPTRCYNPEDSNLHTHRRENLKS